MPSSTLVGRSAMLEISDPWDFVTQNGIGPFAVAVIFMEGEQLVLRFKNPPSYLNKTISLVVATPRHIGYSLSTAGAGTSVSVNLTPVFDVEDNNGSMAIEKAEKWRAWTLIGVITI